MIGLKKILFIGCWLLAISHLQAQSIPNYSFENWDFYRGTTFEAPAHWVTNDILTARFSPKYKGSSTTKTSDAHSGNYAVKMQVVVDHGETVNGCVYSTGSVDSLVYFYSGKANAGFTFDKKATSLNGYYKFSSVGGDSAIFGVTLTKWNKIKSKRDTLVNTVFIAGHPAPEYAPFVVPFKYRVANEMPDTALIVIGIQSAHGQDAHLGTTLYIDDVGFGISK